MSNYWHDARAHSRNDELSDPGIAEDLAVSVANDCESDPAESIGGGELPEIQTKSTHSGLATIVRLQSSELERLARENERLMDRIETLLRLQEREQVLRQQMQAQIGQLGERIAEWQPTALAAPATSAGRGREDEEIKPVLLAMLDLLERMAPGATARTAPKPHPMARGESRETDSERRTESVAAADGHAALPPDQAARSAGAETEDIVEPALDRPASVSAPAESKTDQAEAPGEAFGLPEILKRPIEDLTTARRSTATTASSNAGKSASGPQSARQGRPIRRAAERTGAPAMFAWTSIFS